MLTGVKFIREHLPVVGIPLSSKTRAVSWICSLGISMIVVDSPSN